MTSYQLNTKILRREELAPGIVRLTLEAPEIAAKAKPGQFLMVKASGSDGEPLLRRPFSIHQASANGRIQLLFKVLGKGTSYLAGRQKGDILAVVGPLGQGFSLSVESANICVIGGGLGIAPMFFLVKKMLRHKSPTQIKILLGVATAQEVAVLKNDFAELGTEPEIATDDGTMGHRGFVTDLLPKSLRQEQPWQVYTCGPNPMMRKVAEYCAIRQWSCQASLETVMACGISACLGCTVRSSREKEKKCGRPYLHVCKDGPVFPAGDLAWT